MKSLGTCLLLNTCVLLADFSFMWLSARFFCLDASVVGWIFIRLLFFLTSPASCLLLPARENSLLLRTYGIFLKFLFNFQLVEYSVTLVTGVQCSELIFVVQVKILCLCLFLCLNFFLLKMSDCSSTVSSAINLLLQIVKSPLTYLYGSISRGFVFFGFFFKYHKSPCSLWTLLEDEKKQKKKKLSLIKNELC